MAEHLTNEDWSQIVRWLQGLGLRVVAIHTEKRQLTVELPAERDVT